MSRIKKILCAICALVITHFELSALSLVYNLKIRRSFFVNPWPSADLKWDVTLTPIIAMRNRNIQDPEVLFIDANEKRFTAGSLFTLRYEPIKNWWADIYTGLENEWVTAKGTPEFHTSEFGLDDIIFSTGYNWRFPHHMQLVLYGFFGVPGRFKVDQDDLLDPLVGSRFFSTAIGSEFSYSFIQTKRQSLNSFLQVRFLHFFARHWDPVLPKDALLVPGNVIDILFSMRYRRNFNMIESGYNATFFANQAIKYPFETLHGQNYMNNGFYLTYSRAYEKTPLIQLPGEWGVGISYGRSTRYEQQFFAMWVNIDLLF